MAKTKINPIGYRLGKTKDWTHSAKFSKLKIEASFIYHLSRKLYHHFFFHKYFLKKKFAFKKTFQSFCRRPLQWNQLISFPIQPRKINPFDHYYYKRKKVNNDLLKQKKRWKKNKNIIKNIKIYPVELKLELRRKFLNIFILYFINTMGLHIKDYGAVQIINEKFILKSTPVDEINQKLLKATPHEFLLADWHTFIVTQKSFFARFSLKKQRFAPVYTRFITNNTLFSVYGSVPLREYQFALHKLQQPKWNFPGKKGSRTYRWNAMTLPGFDKDTFSMIKTKRKMQNRGKMFFFSYYRWLSLLNIALHWKSTHLFLKAIVYLFQRKRTAITYNIKFLRGILAKLFLYRTNVQTITVVIRGSFGKITRTTSWSLQKTQKFYKRKQTDIAADVGFAQKQIKRNRGILGVSLWIFFYAH